MCGFLSKSTLHCTEIQEHRNKKTTKLQNTKTWSLRAPCTNFKLYILLCAFDIQPVLSGAFYDLYDCTHTRCMHLCGILSRRNRRMNKFEELYKWPASCKTQNPVHAILHSVQKVLTHCAQLCIWEVWMRWWECLYLASQPISQWVISSGCLSVSLARQWAMVPPCPMAPSNPPDHCLPSCIARPRIEYVCGGAIRRSIRVCVRMCLCALKCNTSLWLGRLHATLTSGIVCLRLTFLLNGTPYRLKLSRQNAIFALRRFHLSGVRKWQ